MQLRSRKKRPVTLPRTALKTLMERQQDLLDSCQWKSVVAVSAAIDRRFGASKRFEVEVAGSHINLTLALSVLGRDAEAILLSRDVIRTAKRYPRRMKKRAAIARSNMRSFFGYLCLYRQHGANLAEHFERWNELKEEVHAAALECVREMTVVGEAERARSLRAFVRTVYAPEKKSRGRSTAATSSIAEEIDCEAEFVAATRGLAEAVSGEVPPF